MVKSVYVPEDTSKSRRSPMSESPQDGPEYVSPSRVLCNFSSAQSRVKSNDLEKASGMFVSRKSHLSDVKYGSKELAHPTTSATATSPTSLFTIDSILAPRPVGHSAPTNVASGLQLLQNSDVISSPIRSANIHPLQQQLHHLAFSSADFLGENQF